MQVDFFAYSQKVNVVPEFGICDDAGKEKPAYIDYDISRQEDWGALVQSENSHDYSFIAVDNNIIIPKPDNEHQEESRCDALLHTNKTIVFIELKDKRKTKAGDAAKQLKTTIKVFKENHDIESFENKKAYVYSRKCENLTEEEKAKLRAEGRKPAIRFNIAKAQKAFHDSSILKFDDVVKGELHMDTDLLGDFVIQKSNGAPTYNFAVVIDDALMKISHVIRGEDHISNTYKQILIFEALGFEVPKFGHLGMILAPDRSKLSKRHGATAVSDFVKQGYLTDALINFVALLGWSPSDGEEIKSVDEIAKDFRLNEISSSNSIFEYDKLKWMNSHYIKMLPMEELKERLKPYLSQYNLNELTDAQYTKMVEITREPLTLLSDITDAVPYFFGKDVHIDEETQTKTLDTEVSQNVLKDFVPKAQTWDWTDENLHEKLADFRAEWKEKGVKPKVTMWAIRAAITGRTCGADMVGILDILGKETSLYRAQKAIK